MTQDRRRWTRLKTLESVEGILRFGEVELVVSLIDQSASGYQISIEGAHGFALGIPMLLFLNGTWTEVRLVRVEKYGNDTRLGLSRDHDLPNDDDFNELMTSWFSFFPRLRASRATTGLALGGIGAVIFLGIGLWMLQDFVRSLQAQAGSQRSGYLLPLSSKPSATPVIFQPKALVEKSLANEAAQDSESRQRSEYVGAARTLFDASFQAGSESDQRAMSMLARIAALCDEKTIDTLQLSRNQLDALTDLVERGQVLLAARLKEPLDEETRKNIESLHKDVCSILNRRQLLLLEATVAVEP